MPIRIEHGRPVTLLTAAQIAGEERAARQQLERTERMQAQQREFEYRTAIRQQDMTVDLQMQKRAKLWEMEKMELRSRLDFQREEQKRQRKIDDAENATRQIEKEIQAGNIDKDDLQVQNLLLYYKIQALTPDRAPPVSLIKPPMERAEKVVSPTQRISAMRALREEEYQEPTWLERALPWGKEPLTPEIEAERDILKGVVRGEYTPPTGTISLGLPEPKTQAEYNAIPSGSQYIDSKGNIRTKS